MLEGEAALTVHNLRGEPLKIRGEVVAAAMGGNPVVKIGDNPPLTFPAGQLARKTFELDLPPGVTRLPWKNIGASGALAVRELRLDRAE